MSENIVIVGAGIGGLTAALALLRKGFDVVVCERSPELGELGAGIHLGPNGVKALFGLGLKDDVMRDGVVSRRREMRMWNTGEAWELPAHGDGALARYGAPYMLMHRGDLHAMLLKAVRNIRANAVLTGARCVDLKQDQDGATVTLEDGRTLRGTAVIGADGVHSVVREKLNKSVIGQFTGNMFWRGLVPMDRVPERERDTAGGWFSPNGTVTVYPIRRGEILNFVGTVSRATWTTLSWTERGTKEEILADFEGWHPHIITIISAIEQPFKWGLFQFETLKEWTDGRCTLLGDACHAMPPSLGQGAIMAIEDGVVLARCFEAHPSDPRRALSRYAAARTERATRVVDASWAERKRRNQPVLANPEEGRAYLSKQFGGQSVNDHYDWIFGYDAHSADI